MEADRPEILLEALHVAADLGADIGIDDSRRGPLELAVLAQNFMRERHVSVGQCRPHDGAGLPLVLGVCVGMQERDGDRLHAGGFQLLARILDAGDLQLLMHVAARQQPLPCLANEVASTPAAGACGTGGYRPPAGCPAR